MANLWITLLAKVVCLWINRLRRSEPGCGKLLRFFGCKPGSKERPSRVEVLRHIEPRSSRIAEVDGGAAAVPLHIHPRDGLEQATPSHRVSTLRQRARPPRGTQRRRRTFPQVVKDLGVIHPSSLIRSVLRVYQRPVKERHLGCGSSCILFAEGHGRRPCTGRRTRKRSFTRCPLVIQAS